MSRVLQVSAERPGAYATIGEALAVAPPGAVLAIDAGIYHETLDLTGATITLAAAIRDRGTGDRDCVSDVVLAGGGSTEAVVRCRDGAVTLRGISVRASGDAAAVHVDQGTLKMERCHLTAEFGPALRSTNCASFTISGCTISSAQQGLVIEDSTGEVEGTTIKDIVDDGVVVRLGATATFRSCTIIGCGHRGIYVYQSGKPTIEGCDISGAGDEGVAIAQHSVGRLVRTYVHETRGVGISFASGTSGNVDSCKIENTAQPGLRIAEGATVEVIQPAPASTAGLGTLDDVKGDAEKVEMLLAELDAMVGLAGVKAEVKAVIDEIQVNAWRRNAGLAVGGTSHHLIFAGAPGTGKTTVARIYGQLLAALGVLAGGPLKEVSRRDLVGQYIGHTAEKTAAVFDECRGGVVFLDEAYALSRQAGGGANDFGQEAIDMIVKLMEDMRNDIAVIAAGYTSEMRDFLDVNPGLASRFVKTIEFENYSAEELTLIITRIISTGDYALAPEAEPLLLRHFSEVERGENFGNARDARKLFELLRKIQSQRLRQLGRKPTLDELRLLTVDDVRIALGITARPDEPVPVGRPPTQPLLRSRPQIHASVPPPATQPVGIDALSRHEVLSRVFSRVAGTSRLPANWREIYDYARPLGGDLVELLAVDLPDTVMHLPGADVQRLGEAALRARATENLLALPVENCDVAEWSGEGTVHIVWGYSFFTASKLLVLDDLLRRTVGQRDLPHGLIVSVPTRHHLIFHLIEDLHVRGLIPKIADHALSAYDESAGGVSPHVYWWQPTGLTQLTERSAQGAVNILGAQAFRDVVDGLEQNGR